jgi:hypothetical protein
VLVYLKETRPSFAKSNHGQRLTPRTEQKIRGFNFKTRVAGYIDAVLQRPALRRFLVRSKTKQPETFIPGRSTTSTGGCLAVLARLPPLFLHRENSGRRGSSLSEIFAEMKKKSIVGATPGNTFNSWRNSREPSERKKEKRYRA